MSRDRIQQLLEAAARAETEAPKAWKVNCRTGNHEVDFERSHELRMAAVGYRCEAAALAMLEHSGPSLVIPALRFYELEAYRCLDAMALSSELRSDGGRRALDALRFLGVETPPENQRPARDKSQ